VAETVVEQGWPLALVSRQRNPAPQNYPPPATACAVDSLDGTTTGATELSQARAIFK